MICTTTPNEDRPMVGAIGRSWNFFLTTPVSTGAIIVHPLRRTMIWRLNQTRPPIATP